MHICWASQLPPREDQHQLEDSAVVRLVFCVGVHQYSRKLLTEVRDSAPRSLCGFVAVAHAINVCRSITEHGFESDSALSAAVAHLRSPSTYELVATALKSVLAHRNRFVTQHADQFSSKRAASGYVSAWAANYEVSDLLASATGLSRVPVGPAVDALYAHHPVLRGLCNAPPSLVSLTPPESRDRESSEATGWSPNSSHAAVTALLSAHVASADANVGAAPSSLLSHPPAGAFSLHSAGEGHRSVSLVPSLLPANVTGAGAPPGSVAAVATDCQSSIENGDAHFSLAAAFASHVAAASSSGISSSLLGSSSVISDFFASVGSGGGAGGATNAADRPLLARLRHGLDASAAAHSVHAKKRHASPAVVFVRRNQWPIRQSATHLEARRIAAEEERFGGRLFMRANGGQSVKVEMRGRDGTAAPTRDVSGGGGERAGGRCTSPNNGPRVKSSAGVGNDLDVGSDSGRHNVDVRSALPTSPSSLSRVLEDNKAYVQFGPNDSVYFLELLSPAAVELCSLLQTGTKSANGSVFLSPQEVGLLVQRACLYSSWRSAVGPEALSRAVSGGAVMCSTQASALKDRLTSAGPPAASPKTFKAAEPRHRASRCAKLPLPATAATCGAFRTAQGNVQDFPIVASDSEEVEDGPSLRPGLEGTESFRVSSSTFPASVAVGSTSVAVPSICGAASSTSTQATQATVMRSLLPHSVRRNKAVGSSPPPEPEASTVGGGEEESGVRARGRRGHRSRSDGARWSGSRSAGTGGHTNSCGANDGGVDATSTSKPLSAVPGADNVSGWLDRGKVASATGTPLLPASAWVEGLKPKGLVEPVVSIFARELREKEGGGGEELAAGPVGCSHSLTADTLSPPAPPSAVSGCSPNRDTLERTAQALPFGKTASKWRSSGRLSGEAVSATTFPLVATAGDETTHDGDAVEAGAGADQEEKYAPGEGQSAESFEGAVGCVGDEDGCVRVSSLEPSAKASKAVRVKMAGDSETDMTAALFKSERAAEEAGDVWAHAPCVASVGVEGGGGVVSGDGTPLYGAALKPPTGVSKCVSVVDGAYTQSSVSGGGTPVTIGGGLDGHDPSSALCGNPHFDTVTTSLPAAIASTVDVGCSPPSSGMALSSLDDPSLSKGGASKSSQSTALSLCGEVKSSAGASRRGSAIGDSRVTGSSGGGSRAAGSVGTSIVGSFTKLGESHPALGAHHSLDSRTVGCVSPKRSAAGGSDDAHQHLPSEGTGGISPVDGGGRVCERGRHASLEFSFDQEGERLAEVDKASARPDLSAQQLRSSLTSLRKERSEMNNAIEPLPIPSRQKHTTTDGGPKRRSRHLRLTDPTPQVLDAAADLGAIEIVSDCMMSGMGGGGDGVSGTKAFDSPVSDSEHACPRAVEDRDAVHSSAATGEDGLKHARIASAPRTRTAGPRGRGWDGGVDPSLTANSEAQLSASPGSNLAAHTALQPSIRRSQSLPHFSPLRSSPAHGSPLSMADIPGYPSAPFHHTTTGLLPFRAPRQPLGNGVRSVSYPTVTPRHTISAPLPVRERRRLIDVLGGVCVVVLDAGSHYVAAVCSDVSARGEGVTVPTCAVFESTMTPTVDSSLRWVIDELFAYRH